MNPIKILVVEDNLTILSLLEDIFKREGWRVFTATDGLDAVETARRELPDAMLLDIMIPKMDGFEVCRTLHEDPKTSHIKIVMLTALNRKGDMDAAKAAGAVDYVIKPFETRSLIKKIQQVVKP